DDLVANSAICRVADQLGKLTYGNGCDFRGNFFLPTVLRRGQLVIAVGSSISHLARQVVLELEEDYGPEWIEYSEGLEKTCARIFAEVPDELERQRLVHQLTSPAMFSMVRSGDTEHWRSQMVAVIARIDSYQEKSLDVALEGETT
ncbi:MAG: hypothetical protein HY692_09045, partial [Cyanobacteria bacterium NC_groundwater_1444_Ag_S-0.65um_54_12]|nr:hypothetical protein [Cyanobacteria bacterium NC_groundwater_1444_Ag_S-0.65um_54_12]